MTNDIDYIELDVSDYKAVTVTTADSHVFQLFPMKEVLTDYKAVRVTSSRLPCISAFL